MIVFLSFSCLFLLCVELGYSASLPSSFKKCKKDESDFQDCLFKAIQDAIPQLEKPFWEAGLRNIEPVIIPKVSVAAGNGPTDFQQNLNNMQISGYTKSKLTKLDWNFDKKIVSLTFVIPKMHIELDYDFKGKLMFIPFYGAGPGTIDADNFVFDFKFYFDEYEKNGKKYYKFKTYTLSMMPEIMRVKLENLFGGDPVLSKTFDKIINENWKVLFEDVQAGYEQVFGEVFADMFKRLTERISITEMFS